jgi:hypothetical protein
VVPVLGKRGSIRGSDIDFSLGAGLLFGCRNESQSGLIFSVPVRGVNVDRKSGCKPVEIII